MDIRIDTKDDKSYLFDGGSTTIEDINASLNKYKFVRFGDVIFNTNEIVTVTRR